MLLATYTWLSTLTCLWSTPSPAAWRLLQTLAALVVVLAFAAASVFAEHVDDAVLVQPRANPLTTSARKLLWLKDDGKQWCWYYQGKSQHAHKAHGV